MIFTTYWFLFFALATVAVYWLLPRSLPRQIWLGLACVVFHFHFAGPAGVIPIVVLAIMTYLAGLSRNRALCLAAMVVSAAALCFYKYILFFIGEVVSPLSASLATTLSTDTRHWMPGAPPLAISFFTFEFVHYLFEVRRGGEPIRNPLKFICFAIFFPSLVAGPIKRYTQFIPSLEEATAKRAESSDFAVGLARIAMGFFKKVVIADQLTLYVDQNQPLFGQMGLIGRWGLLAAIAIRILMDFSGYSDIAIGSARLLGITLPENFNWPYLADSIQEFWQRWHISLSSWIRDYIYIPLGGSRRGVPRRILNGLIAFGLCGLWHGAAWHFVVWGLYHGVGLVVCATYKSVPGLGKTVAGFLAKEPVSSLVLTQLYVWVGWLLFFYPVADALHMTAQLFGQ